MLNFAKVCNRKGMISITRETLKMIWESQGLTGDQAARKCGITRATLYRMNKGGNVSSLTEAKVYKAFEIQIDDAPFDQIPTFHKKGNA
jgi:DNA-binding phage protein